MPENYRGFDLNTPNDIAWGQRENSFHKQIIDRVLDNPSFLNTIYVSPEGSDETGTGIIGNAYNTIGHAISTIVDNSTENPYCIQLAAGIYTETGTVMVGEGIFINGTGDSSILRTTAQNVTMFEMGNQSDISKVTIEGPTNANAVSIIDAGAVVSFKNIKFNNCYRSVYINALGATVNMYSTSFRGSDTIDYAVQVDSGVLNIYTANALGMSGANYFKISGDTSVATIGTLTIFDSTVTTPLLIENGATFILSTAVVTAGTYGAYINGANTRVILSNMMFQYNDTGIHIGPDGPIDVSLSSVTFENTLTYDFHSETSNMKLSGQGNFIAVDKFKYDNGVPTNGYYISYLSDTEGDEATVFKSEISVGTPDRPSESAFGEGDSYVRGMAVYQYDPTSEFVDITNAAKSYSGSTFEFSDVIANSALYFTSTLDYDGDYVKFFGIKLSIAASGTTGTGSLITEYWNGTEWTEAAGMITAGNSPYLPLRECICSASAGSYQIRYNAFINSDWSKNDPMSLGTSYYWMRIRIVSDITTSPIFEQLKIHSNRTEINGDGWVEYFGKARPIGRFPWDYGMVQAAVASPGNQDQFLSDNLDVGKIENAFANNSDDRIGFLAPVPFDLDVSTPIKLRFATIASANTGDVSWTVRWGYSTTSDIIYTSQAGAPTTHPTEQSITFTTTVPATTGQIQWNTAIIPFSGLLPRDSDGISDIVWVSIQRNGTADSFAGTVGFVAIAGDYVKWTDGGHV